MFRASMGALPKGFDRLEVLMGDMAPLTRFAADVLQQSTETSIASEVDPATGRPWAPLSASTMKRRAVSGKSSGTASLLRSLHGGTTATTAWIGSDLPQATTQQYGARRGAFGRLANGRPLPWGDIPARPFLGISTETMESLATGLMQRLAAVLKA